MNTAPSLILASLLSLGATSPGIAAAPSAASWFSEQGYVPPEGGRLIACHGYGCARRTPIALPDPLMARAASLLRAARSSPDAERRALGEIVRLFTAQLAAQFGGEPDKPRSPPQLSGQNGQMDCIDEAANTTSLLVILEDQGWLTYHRVKRPQSRGFFIDGRYPHTTAVVAETRSRMEWAVDPWAKAPGQLPEILPLARWRQDS